MRYTYRFFSIVCLAAFLYATPALSDPSYDFISEDISFEDIFSDIPDDFDPRSATVADFLKLPFFTLGEARNIVSFRNSLRTGESLYDHLEEIPGLSPIQLAVLNHLAPRDKLQYLTEFSGSLRNGFIHRPEQETVSEGKYYLKIHSKWRDTFRVTILGEHDQFEPRAFDLFSANASITGFNNRINVILGDYRPGYGQGLVFSRYGRSYVYGADVVISEAKNVTNTLFEESNFLRGCYI